MFFRAREDRKLSRKELTALCAIALSGALAGLPIAPAFAGGSASGFNVEPGGGKDGGGKDRGDKGSDFSSGGDAEGFSGNSDSGKAGKVKLAGNGDAIPPKDAPKQVVKVIEAANEINKMPYKYGGGHGGKKDSKGYDCSGAVSHALRGGKFLKSPEDSGGLAKWGKEGKGDWITVYANKGHAYMTVGKLRFDTSSAGARGGNQDGPRWWKEKASSKGYEARHPAGF
jgi:cell wall-associated NlpC family hydrolase